eukprot:361775-Chlamydomonas_euryale.AAC.5
MNDRLCSHSVSHSNRPHSESSISHSNSNRSLGYRDKKRSPPGSTTSSAAQGIQMLDHTPSNEGMAGLPFQRGAPQHLPT